MATVFPWTPDSRLTAAILVGAVLAGSILLVWLHLLGARLLRKLEDTTANAPVWRAPRVIARAKRLLGWTTAFTAAYGLAYALTWTYAPLGNLFWTPMLANLPTVLIIGATLVLVALMREAIRHLSPALEARAKSRGKTFNRQAIHALQLLLDAAVLVLAGVVLIAGALDILGYQGDLGAAIVGWLTAQAGSLILIATLVGVGWFGSVLIRATTREFRYSSRLSPRVVDAVGSVSRGALFAVLGIIGLVTLLQSIGLGSVGGTLVVVLSSFVGLTVAMAGTGSIGNALSGMVLLAMRPMDKGDRVILLDNMVCDVEEVTLMFTRVKTLSNERVDIPNNQVLAKPIRNVSQSPAHAIVVPLGIGYDVPHERVRELAIQAASLTPDIVADPAPKVYARELANYAISYDLYAYTTKPRHLQVKSDLLGKLQEVFHAGGVEILTPDVYQLRHAPPGETSIKVPVQAPVPAAAAPTTPAKKAER